MGVINEELDLSIDSIDNGTADTTVDNGSDTTTITNPPAPEDKGSNEGNNQQSSSTGEDTTTQTDNNTANNNQDVTVAEGDQVTIDDIPCTIDAQGNAVDANGTIIKTSEELQALIAANTTEEPSVLSVLQERFGADFKDENGNQIVFEDSVEGINSYIDTVLQARMQEREEAAVNNLFKQYPVLEQAYSHLKLNGSIEGFNEIPDRSDVVIDKDNEEQQIAVIKEEWALEGKKGNVNSYIDYLKASGILYDTAVESNKTVAEIYNDRRAEQTAKREAAEAEESAAIDAYWKSVDETIAKGEILGYKIPETIQRTFDGKTTVATRADFQKYLTKVVDDEGNTAYMLDDAKVDSNSRMQDDLLRAYLRFTGGNYSSLVNMAVNKEKVIKLRTQAQQAATRKTLVLNSGNKSNKHVDNNDLVLS